MIGDKPNLISGRITNLVKKLDLQSGGRKK
jgi:hypothetical protein